MVGGGGRRGAGDTRLSYFSFNLVYFLLVKCQHKKKKKLKAIIHKIKTYLVLSVPDKPWAGMTWLVLPREHPPSAAGRES